MVQIIRRTGQSKRPQLQLTIPIEPVPYTPKQVKKRIATFDTETDPFAPGRAVKPFTCGFYIPDCDRYEEFWGDDCIQQFFDWLKRETAKGGEFEGQEFLIFVHNGGNFDFYFFVDHFDSGHAPFIINGRLVRVIAQGQEFRDSYSNIPVALGEYDKLKLKNGIRDTTIPEDEDSWYKSLPGDYSVMENYPVCSIFEERETTVRELYKNEILTYQKRDCISLAELVTQWLDMFGDKLTMASVALPMLRSYHGFETLSENLDRELRPFYFGGRNQCFATGVMQGDFKIYDITSSYPDVMRRYMHPISDIPKYDNKITERTHFAYIRAWSLGALPVRKPDGSLDFPIGTFDFYACIHEIKAGLATGTLRIIKVYHSIYFDEETNFAEFIDTFFALRQDASEAGDEIRKLFYKLVMNSSYGKFAQDPRKYENWLFDPNYIPQPFYCEPCHTRIQKKEPPIECVACTSGSHSPYGWYLHTTRDGRNIYASPQRVRAGNFYNVATAASITSAARASLLYGIQAAERPIYCDTDSLICTNFTANEHVRIHPKELGAWKLEAEGDTVCIAGKKLYAVFNEGKLVKKASKGVKLSGDEIRRVCAGEVIEYAHPVPKFTLDRQKDGSFHKFVTRNIRRTG